MSYACRQTSPFALRHILSLEVKQSQLPISPQAQQYSLLRPLLQYYWLQKRVADVILASGYRPSSASYGGVPGVYRIGIVISNVCPRMSSRLGH